MKKVVGLAAAGLLAVSAANAGQITVANTDLTLLGGVSAGYNVQNNDNQLNGGGFSKDSFTVNNFVIALAKPAEVGGIGFVAAFGSWEAPTVVASSKAVNDLGLVGHGKTTDFKPWKAFLTYKPIQGLTLDAGLLWVNFGEKPVTIFNPHITRGVLFTANPALFAGARATYDAGIAKVYVGTGKVGTQLMQPVYANLGIISGLGAAANVTPKSYIEAGITGNLKQVGLPVDVGLHTYNEAGGRDIYALTVGADYGIVTAGLEVDYFHADDNLKTLNGQLPAAGLPNLGSSAWGTALCVNVKPVAGVQIPVRIEYADNKDSVLIPAIAVGYSNNAPGILLPVGPTGYHNNVWTFTITPTYNPTKNTFIRAELSYAKAKEISSGGFNYSLFVDSKGETKSSRTTGAVEVGFLF